MLFQSLQRKLGGLNLVLKMLDISDLNKYFIIWVSFFNTIVTLHCAPSFARTTRCSVALNVPELELDMACDENCYVFTEYVKQEA